MKYILSIRGQDLRLSMHSHLGERYLFDYKSIHFNTVKYFAIASETVAHWTLGCSPGDLTIKPFHPPRKNVLECSKTPNDVDYKGHLSLSEKGRACLPWISHYVPGAEKMFVENETIKAINYCRNVLDRQSAYCYVYYNLTDRITGRESCHIPKCRVKICRGYGTGVGNMLNISTSASGRNCKDWTKTDGKIRAMFNADNNTSEFMRYLLDAKLSKNFCRNPNKDIAGPWCITTDPDIKSDLCDIPDCDRPFNSITLVTTNAEHETYIKPMWRITGWKFWVKKWVHGPNIDTGFALTLLSADRKEYFQIVFDTKNDSKVLLFYFNEPAPPVQVERYTPFNFFLFIPNHWTGYHLTVRPDRLVMGIVGEPHPFLSWEYSFLFGKILGIGPDYRFTPQFLIYEKTGNGVLGFSFDTEDSFVELLKAQDQGTYYPLTYMNKDSLNLTTNDLVLFFQGRGNVLISFYNVISFGPEMTINVGSGEFHDRLLTTIKDQGHNIAIEVNRTDGPTIMENEWTDFTIRITEENVTVYRLDDEFSFWNNPRALRVYHFRLQTHGNITWIANSNPPAMNIKPIDGGWAEWMPWNCSTSCGGGRGYRERECSAPEPSLFGAPCVGEPSEYGVCNTHECGDLPPTILEIIGGRMKHYVYAQSLREYNDSIRIGCYGDILQLIKEQVPDFSVYWDRNGKAVTNRTVLKDVTANNYWFHKQEAETSDSGVYSCAISTPLGRFRPIQITSVIVKTNSSYTFVGFTGELFVFHSYNQILAATYKELELVWLHNGKPSDKYTEIYLPLMTSKDMVLEMEDTGEWECTVRNKEFNLFWRTNWVKIKVRYRSDFVKYLMDDNKYTKVLFKDFKEPAYVKISFVILVILTAALSLGVAFILIYCQLLLARKVKKVYTELIDSLVAEGFYEGGRIREKIEIGTCAMSIGYIEPLFSESEIEIKEPENYDEYDSVSDSTDQPDLKKKIMRRKSINIPTQYGSQKKESQKTSLTRSESCKRINLPLWKEVTRREEESRRDEMIPDSSSSSSNSFRSIYDDDPNARVIFIRPVDPYQDIPDNAFETESSNETPPMKKPSISHKKPPVKKPSISNEADIAKTMDEYSRFRKKVLMPKPYEPEKLPVYYEPLPNFRPGEIPMEESEDSTSS